MKWYEDPAEITKRRNLLGVTQKELAETADVERTWLVMVERGKINIRDDKLRRSVKAKRTRLWEALAIIENERRDSPPVPLSDLLKPAKVKELIFRRPSMDVKRLVREVQQDPDFVRVLREVSANLLKDNQELRAQVAELRGRVDLLCDLLDVKTREVRAAAEAEELKSKLER